MRLNLSKVPSFGALLFGGSRHVMTTMGVNGSAKKRTAEQFGRQLFQLKGSSVLAISRGDLTQWEGDAIVNAANERMLGGGGVDGAIHRAAGPKLLDACWDVEEVAPHVRCPMGEARITPGFRLKAKYVIHTVGPIYDSHEESSPFLANAFKNSLLLLKEKGLKTVAFPAISCGIFGYPQAEAAKVSISTILAFSEDIDLVEFVLFGKDTYEPFVAEAAGTLKRVPESGGDDASDGGERVKEQDQNPAGGDEEGPASASNNPQTAASESEGIHSSSSAPAKSESVADVDGMDMTAKSKRGEGDEGHEEPESKIHKGEQTAVGEGEAGAGQLNDSSASKDERAQSGSGELTTPTPSQTEGRRDEPAAPRSSGGVVSPTDEVSSMDVSETATVTMAGEDSSESAAVEAAATMETDLQDSQETVLMEDSQEEPQTVAGESPSEEAGIEQGSCSTGDNEAGQHR